MTLYIWKYKDTPQKNYFEGCTYIDKIAVQSFLEIPSFTQEFNSETDYTQLKTDNFTVRLSKLSPEKSVNGDTLEDFLFPAEDKDNKFLVLFELKPAESEEDLFSRRAGFIQLESLVINETLPSGTDSNGKSKWYIEFTVIGILREFAEYYESKNINALNSSWNDITFDNYLQNLHFSFSPLWQLENRLNMTAKAGAEVKVSSPLQNDIITNHGINISQWRGFKDTALGLGFSFQLICNSLQPLNHDTPYFSLYLFWRSNGMQTVTIDIIEHLKGVSLKYNNKWVFMANRHHITSQHEITRTDINGWLIRVDATYNFDSLPGWNSRPIFIAQGYSERFGIRQSNLLVEEILGQAFEIQWTDLLGFKENLFNVSSFPPKISPGSITYSRIFVLDYSYTAIPAYYLDSGVQQIMANTAIEEYKFLIKGIKESKKFKVVYDKNSNIGLFSKFSFSQDGISKTFLIERIYDMNIYNQTCSIECIEI